MIRLTINGQEVEGRAPDIAELLQAMGGVSVQTAPAKGGPGRPAKTGAGMMSVGRRKPASPALQAARKKQGQYMGVTRTLSRADKARVSAVREKDIDAAIKLARELLAKKKGK